LASNRWTCLCVGIRLPIAWGLPRMLRRLPRRAGAFLSGCLAHCNPAQLVNFSSRLPFARSSPSQSNAAKPSQRTRSLVDLRIARQLELRLAR
jgi:hypothetical protein